MVKFAGAKFDFGGMELIIPPLPARLIVEHHELIFGEAEISGIKSVMTARIPIMLVAIQRNYPEFTLDMCWEFVTVRNMAAVWYAVCGITKEAETKGEA